MLKLNQKNTKKAFQSAGIALLIPGLIACSDPKEKVEQYMEEGTQLFDEEKYPKARIQFKNALQINPKIAEAYYKLAQMDEKIPNWPNVYKNLSKAIEIDTTHIAARIKLGQLLLLNREFDKVQEQLDAIFQLEPDNNQARLLQAALMFQKGETAAALEQADELVRLMPDSIEAISLKSSILIADNRFDEALNIINRGLEAHPDNKPLHLLRLRLHAQTHQEEALEQDLRELIKLEPSEQRHRISLARLLRQQGKNDAAEQVMRDLIKLDPTDQGAKIALFEFIRQSDEERALSFLQQQYEEDAESADIGIHLANFYRQKGQIEEAKSLLEDISSKSSDEAQLRAKVLLASLYLREQDKKTAGTILDEVLQKDKENEEALLLHSVLLLDEEKADEAINDLRIVLRAAPDSDRALVLLARAYLQTERQPLAIDSFRKALAANPGNVMAAMPLVEDHIRNRRLDRAEEILSSVLQERPEFLPGRQRLAQVQIDQSEWAAAKATIAKLADNPAGEEAAETLSSQLELKRGDSTKAINGFKKILEESDSIQMAPLDGLIRAYESLDKREELISYLKELETSKSDARLSAAIGSAYGRDSDYVNAVEYAEKAVSQQPKAAALWALLAKLQEEGGDKEAALKTYNTAREELPGNGTVMMAQASLLERMEKYDDAIDVYDDLLKAFPDSEIATNNLASLLSDHGENPETLARSRELAEKIKKSKNPYFQDTYAWILIKLGENLSEAQRILENVVRQESGEAVFQYHLAKAYELQGNDQQAIKYLDSALSIGGFSGIEDAEALKVKLEQRVKE